MILKKYSTSKWLKTPTRLVVVGCRVEAGWRWKGGHPRVRWRRLSVVIRVTPVRGMLGAWGGIQQRIIWWRHHRETLPYYWRFVRGIHRSPVDFPRKGPVKWSCACDGGCPRGISVRHGKISRRKKGKYWLHLHWNGANFVNIGGTGVRPDGIRRCLQWRRSWHHDDSRISVSQSYQQGNKWLKFINRHTYKRWDKNVLLEKVTTNIKVTVSWLFEYILWLSQYHYTKTVVSLTHIITQSLIKLPINTSGSLCKHPS